MEAKIAFLTQVLWGSSVCYCVQSILNAGRYNPLTYGEQQQSQEQVIQFQNASLCYMHNYKWGYSLTIKK